MQGTSATSIISTTLEKIFGAKETDTSDAELMAYKHMYSLLDFAEAADTSCIFKVKPNGGTMKLRRQVERGAYIYIKKEQPSFDPEAPTPLTAVERFRDDLLAIYDTAIQTSSNGSAMYKAAKEIRGKVKYLEQQKLRQLAAEMAQLKVPAIAMTAQAICNAPLNIKTTSNAAVHRQKRRYTRSGAYKRDKTTGEFVHSTEERKKIVQTAHEPEMCCINRLDKFIDRKVRYVNNVTQVGGIMFPASGRAHVQRAIRADLHKNYKYAGDESLWGFDSLPPAHPLAECAPERPPEVTIAIARAQTLLLTSAAMYRKSCREGYKAHTTEAFKTLAIRTAQRRARQMKRGPE